MVKLLTRRELWIALILSLCLWGVLALVGQKLGLNDDKLRAFTQFSRIFPGLIIGLTVMTLAFAAIEDDDDKNSVGEIETFLKNGLAGTDDKQRQILEELAALRREIRSQPASSMAPASSVDVKTSEPAKLGELSGALSEAMKQITSRDGQIDLLTKNVNQSNIQRNLVRLTQSLEISLSLQKRIIAGQSDPAESMQFIVDDLESALAANGVEHMVILPGTKIPELKAGSFIPVTVIEAPSPELKGTVKEVRTRAYFINEENRPRFISPAKVVLYKA